MKKAMILLALTCVLCGLALANGNGAQKVDLFTAPIAADSEVVGWVIFNVNAEGVVIAEVHLNDGEEGTYIVRLNRGDNDSYVANVDEDTVTVNKAGKGNAHLAGDLAGSTQARLNVLNETAPGQKYTTGWIDM